MCRNLQIQCVLQLFWSGALLWLSGPAGLNHWNSQLEERDDLTIQITQLVVDFERFDKDARTERQINTGSPCGAIYLALFWAFDVVRTHLLNSDCSSPYYSKTYRHLLYILTNVKTLAQSHFTVNASQNVTADIIDGFLKIFRLERINARDHSHSTPICIHK